MTGGNDGATMADNRIESAFLVYQRCFECEGEAQNAGKLVEVNGISSRCSGTDDEVGGVLCRVLACSLENAMRRGGCRWP